jgi:adenosine deaminase
MEPFAAFIDYIREFQEHLYSRNGFIVSIEEAMRTAEADGVTELEMSIDCQILPEFGSAQEVVAVLREISDRYPTISIRSEVGINREWDSDKLDQWVVPLIETGYFAAVDLYGNELNGPPELFTRYYALARESGMRCKAHAGEYQDAEFVRRSVEVLQLDEVQHGIYAAESNAVMRWLADHHVRLNVCPTSNIRLGRVSEMSAHPIRKLYDAGVHVTINSDDILVFNQTVSQEYLNLYTAGVMTASELDGIRVNAFRDNN